MEKYFNTQGVCYPDEHYMVNMDERLREIKKLIDRKKYFSINRGRQYGKTTTLFALEKYLKDDYTVVNMDFQFFTQEAFHDEAAFSCAFAKKFMTSVRNMSDIREEGLWTIKKCAGNHAGSMDILFEGLSEFCDSVKRPAVLMIDEADSAADNQVFRDFLSLLRGYYIHRDKYPSFQSVILTGVYDIRRLKEKIRPGNDHKKNSPWNIAVDFDVDMSLSVKGIEGMLAEYENDHHVGMDINEIAGLLYDYTAGYPFLVSRLCQLMDEKIYGTQDFSDRAEVWTKEGFLEAEKLLLMEKNSLFESLVNKLTDYPKLRDLLYSMLFQGNKVIYNPDNDVIDTAFMFGFVKNVNGLMQVSNRIFEMRLYNLFLAEEEISSGISSKGVLDKNQFVQNGVLNMELLLERFVVHWEDLYSSSDEKFIEDNGRKFFLLYLKPVINGVGNYYIESQTRDNGRTDIIVDYLGKQYIIELKIWHGEEYNKRGEEQLVNYLEAYHMQKGYLLSFNFNKKKKTGIKKITIGDKLLIEAVV